MTSQQDIDKRLQGISAGLMLIVNCPDRPPIPAGLSAVDLTAALAVNEAIALKQWERNYLWLSTVQKDETTLPTPDVVAAGVAQLDQPNLAALAAKLSPLLAVIPGAAPAVAGVATGASMLAALTALAPTATPTFPK